MELLFPHPGDQKMNTFEIEKESDYGQFLNNKRFVNSKPGRSRLRVNFYVKFNSVKEFDVELLSLYYLIREKFSDRYAFRLEIKFNWKYAPGDSNLFKLAAYCHIVENVESVNVKIAGLETKVYFIDGKPVGLRNYYYTPKSLSFRRMLPLMIINKDNYDFLRKKIDNETWESIKTTTYKNSPKTYQNLIKGTINNLLFQKANFNKELFILREELYGHDNFYKLIEGLPIISLVIFAMFDYAYRDEALKIYKNEIKEVSKEESVKLSDKDFLYEKQNEQLYPRFEAYNTACKKKYDNKTLWDNYNAKTVHPFVVKELFEAVSISEGILQLLENIVLHADKGNGRRIGTLSIYMRNKNTDKALLMEKYTEYSKQLTSNAEGRKYFFEISIEDLSGTNIPAMFKENNKQYKKDSKDSTFDKICLRDFFDPPKEKREFWQRFYNKPERAIKHYGLQIFDSIISSRNGLFIVDSGEDAFCNLSSRSASIFTWGTKYQILCPVNEENYEGSLTNDHLFRFEELKEMPIPVEYSPVGTEEDVDNEIINVCESIKASKWTGGQLLQIDMGEIKNTELFVKGILMAIFDISKPERVNDKNMLLLALLNCEAYQILEIVRIISLYYDKQGTNRRMSNTQIYIRGKKAGEEVLFFGEKLSDVIQNITKSACIRGIMYENIDTIDYLLKREKEDE